MKKIIAHFAIFYACFSSAAACDCLWTASFCETVVHASDGSPSVVAIVQAEVHKRTEEEIIFKITNTIYGGDTKEKYFSILTLYDDFHPGADYIVALHQPLSEPQYFNWCTTDYLPIKDGKVRGYITKEISEMPLSEFTKLDFCGLSQPALTVNPTLLAGNILTANPHNWYFPLTVKIAVFNAIGQLVFSKKISGYSGDMQIELELENILSGVYFCQITYGDEKQTLKIVKQ